MPGLQIGFIAQDVQKVVPEIVATSPVTGLESVDYARVTPLLVEALKAQEQRLNAQQKEIDLLRSELQALKR